MDSVSGVGVIDKAALILRALRDRPRDLAELQDATGLPRATAHRLLVALEQHHLVRRDAQGRFCLGFELVALGRVAAEQFGLGEVAMPAMQHLRDTCGESVQLYVREGDRRVCVVSPYFLPDPPLVAALDAGRLGHAVLDVFRTEPLPDGHPFWAHPRITVTPHTSARTLRDESIAQIAGKIRALERGEPITGIVEPERGY